VFEAGKQILKLQGHWWMLWCSPVDGKLCATALDRHFKRIVELQPQVNTQRNIPSS
jgi:hypothetical protein